MEEEWGRWACPYEGCEAVNTDPDSTRVTCCGVDGHTVILGQVEKSGWRWAEKYVPDDTDRRAIALANGVFL